MNWIKVVEKYKLAVIRYGNVMYNIMTKLILMYGIF